MNELISIPENKLSTTKSKQNSFEVASSVYNIGIPSTKVFKKKKRQSNARNKSLDFTTSEVDQKQTEP